MKLYISLIAVAVSISVFAQNAQIKWGEEFRLRKGSTELEVIYADKNGVFLQETHEALKSYFVIGASLRGSATLVRLDKNLAEIFRNDFNSELKGKEFVQFFAIRDKMFLFASDYEKSDRTLNIYGAEVNKNSGELKGAWIQFASFQKNEKNDEINFKLTLGADSSRMVVVSSIEGKERNEYSVQEFDSNLKPASKAVTISNEFDKKTFQLEDVLYTRNNKIVLVGRIYEYQEGKKKKDKFLEFANYNIRIYDEKGKQQKEINTNINGKWLTSTKLVQGEDDDIVLSAFYNNQRKGKTIDGMLVQRINSITGDVVTTSDKPINNSLLGDEQAQANEENDEEESKAERKERERLDKIINEGDQFSKYMRFRNIFYTPDEGLVITAEKYYSYTYTTQEYTPASNGMPGRWSTTTYYVYESGDILMCKVDKAGNIGWMRVLPKNQREVISSGTNYSYGGLSFGYMGFFDPSGYPRYSGFGALQSQNDLYLLFNDNPKNIEVTQPGQRVKKADRFARSECFIIKVNLLDGKLERRRLFSNKDVPTSTPRLSSVIGEDMYLVGREDRLLGKTKIAVAKISL